MSITSTLQASSSDLLARQRRLPVPGYEGLYEISDSGNIYSLPRHGTRGGIKTPQDNGGTVLVQLWRKGRYHTHQVHKLVLTAFVGPRPPGQRCRHLDGDHTNNALDNLRWDTRAPRPA